LIADAAGNLYGTTEYGGDWLCGDEKNCGTVFELRRQGDGYVERKLYSFVGAVEGEYPVGGLVLGKNGVLYGTTTMGGSQSGACFPVSCGTVFALTPTGKGYREQILHSFLGGTDGAYPTGTLIADDHVVIYGTTEFGGGGNPRCHSSPSGPESCGMVYKITPGGFETVLHRFRGGMDGANPIAGLLWGENDHLYGVTDYGGGHGTRLGGGTVFELPSAGERPIEKILYRFCSVRKCTDGEHPADSDGLRTDTNGDLYGTTQAGGDGTCQCGNAFVLRPSGSGYTEAVLHNFQGNDGAQPYGGIVLAGKNAVFGTTAQGGSSSQCAHGCGVVYEIPP